MSSSVSSDRRVSPPRERPDKRPLQPARLESAFPLPPLPLPSRPGSRVLGVERWLVRRMLQALGNPAVDFVLWNGEEVHSPAGPAVARVVLGDRQTLWKLLVGPDLHFGDAYSAGRLEVQGDLLAMLEGVYRCEKPCPPPGRSARPLAAWLPPRRSNTLAGSRANIHHHYDIGDDFYRLWLDERNGLHLWLFLLARRPRWKRRSGPKMDYVCRKLWLRPGETVVEAGCGWGALALHMARHYGVRVRACNVSREQIKYARRRARSEGLDDRVQFIEDDYRNIRGRCDAFVSVGMLEHVGVGTLRRVRRNDRPLPQSRRPRTDPFIGRDQPGRINPGSSGGFSQAPIRPASAR